MPETFREVLHGITVRVKARWESEPDLAMFNISFRDEANELPGAAQVEAAVSVVDGWLADYRLYMDPKWRIEALEGFSRAVQDGPYFNMVESVVGTMGGTSTLQPDLAPLVLLHGPNRGYSELGRKYVFSPTEEVVQLRRYQANYMDNLAGIFTSLKVAATSVDLNLAIASEALGQAIAVSTITTSGRLTKQTRRRIGYGG